MRGSSIVRRRESSSFHAEVTHSLADLLLQRRTKDAANDAYCAVQVYARLQLMALSPNDWTSVTLSPQLTSSSHDEAFVRAILHRPGEGLDCPNEGRWWKLPSGGWFDWVEERVCRKRGGNGRETPAKG